MVDYFARMWFLNLPDILVFLAIWWAGFLTCFFLGVICLLILMWSGNSVTFGCTTKDKNEDKFDF